MGFRRGDLVGVIALMLLIAILLLPIALFAP